MPSKASGARILDMAKETNSKRPQMGRKPNGGFAPSACQKRTVRFRPS